MNATMTQERATFGRPAPQPSRPVEFRLAGRLVTQSMYSMTQNAKRGGRKVWLVSADDPAGDNIRGAIAGVGDDDCPNCNGFGQFILDIAAAGPFKNHPGTVISDTETGATPQSATVHNGAWWRVVRQVYPCPVCSPTREVIL